LLPAAGTYDMSLRVISVSGCEEIVSKPGYLTVYGPTADFVSDKPGGCQNSNISFRDSSVSDGLHPITQWTWNFGDSSAPATGPQVNHTFSNTGRYPVSLKVTDSYGCTDERIKANFVSITNGKAMFTTTDTLSCIGAEVVFVDTSTGLISNWEWSFGDGNGTTGVQSPTHRYADSGYYTVKLKITETSGCIDSVTKAAYITIRNPDAKFGLSDTFSTCPPLTVSFYDSSYYVKKWQWDFGDGGGSPVASPVNLYNIPNLYNVKLTVTSPGGCKDSAFAKIRILGPYGQFNYTPLSGCTPLQVNYSVSNTQAVKFLWDFSDGVTDSGTVATASHLYTSGGRFVPKVILTDAAGCRVPVIGKDSIYIEKTELDFTGSKLEFCDSGMVSFTNQSVVVNAPTVSYTWFFDSTTATTKNAAHSFISPGAYDITLSSTTAMGCRDTLTKKGYIRIHQSPVAVINSQDSLCKPAGFTFTAQLQPDTSGIRSWRWNFGNGNTDTTQSPAEQLFPEDGSFANSLFIEDNEGCTTTVSKTVVVHPLPVLQVLKEVMICRGDTARLSASGAVSYQWLAPNDNLSCTDCPNPTASPLYDMMYRVEGSSEYGCKSYDSALVRVFQPYKVTVEKPLGFICEGRNIQLKAFGAPLYSWSPAAGLSAANIQNPFASPDTTLVYTVKGYDSLGCFSDSAEVRVEVLGTPSVDAGSDVVASAGTTTSLSATGSSDVVSYTWTPATGLSCVDCPNPEVSVGDNIAYTVRVTNAAGCSATDQVKVLVTCNESNLFVPNTFTPNGDGMNDVFYIRGKGLFAVKSMKIFNRWGELVFEKKDVTPNNASDGWNGFFKGMQAPTDTYVYQLEVLCTNTQVLKFNGTISLIR
jgi:gliding motility-associated-like protein